MASWTRAILIGLGSLCILFFILMVVAFAGHDSGSSVTPTGACTGQFVESLPLSGATTSTQMVVELMSLPACRGLTPDQQHQVLTGLSAFALKMEQVKA